MLPKLFIERTDFVTLCIMALVLLLFLFEMYKSLKLNGENIPDSDSGIFGCKQIVRLIKNSQHEMTDGKIEKRKKFGDIYLSRILFYKFVTVWNMEVINEIYKNGIVFPIRTHDTTMNLYAKGLKHSLIGPIKNRKHVKRILSKLFTTSMLKENIAQTIKKQSEILIQQLANESDGLIDVKKMMKRYVFDLFLQFLIGKKDENNINRLALHRLRELLYEKEDDYLFSNIFILCESLFRLATQKFTEAFDISIFDTDLDQCFNKFIKQIKTSKNNLNENTFLKLMLDMHATRELTWKELYGNIQLFNLANDFSHNALTFMICNLALHENIQNKLRENIQEAFKKHGETLSFDWVKEIKYLDMCIHESQRMFPAICFITRCCERDIQINGYNFKRGMHVEIPLYGLGRDTRYWKQPNQFDPDRMKDKEKMKAGVFDPFGRGSQMCLGYKAGKMILRYTICKLLLNYKFFPTENTKKLPLKIEVKKMGFIQPMGSIQLEIQPLK